MELEEVSELGAGVEGACGSVRDHRKGLGVGKTLKCFWNWKAVGV